MYSVEYTEGRKDWRSGEPRTVLRIVNDGKIAEYFDCGEPEDQSFDRDWSWVIDELIDAYYAGLRDAKAANRRDEMSGHHWIPEEDARLLAAVDELRAIDVADWRKMKVGLWQAVASRLMPGMRVTPNACQCRTDRLRQMAAEAAKKAECMTEPVAPSEGPPEDPAVDDSLVARLTRIESMQKRTLDLVGDLRAIWK